MVLRSQKLILGTTLVALAVAVAAALIVHSRSRTETIKQPTLRYEQTADAVTVFIHNPNKTWGLRDQRIVVVFVGERRNIIRSYGPNEGFARPDEPHLAPHCCLIPSLAPGADFVFRFSASPVKVAGVTMDPDPAPQWIRWRAGA